MLDIYAIACYQLSDDLDINNLIYKLYLLLIRDRVKPTILTMIRLTIYYISYPITSVKIIGFRRNNKAKKCRICKDFVFRSQYIMMLIGYTEEHFTHQFGRSIRYDEKRWICCFRCIDYNLTKMKADQAYYDSIKIRANSLC
jgi:hypothetical protein